MGKKKKEKKQKPKKTFALPTEKPPKAKKKK